MLRSLGGGALSRPSGTGKGAPQVQLLTQQQQQGEGKQQCIQVICVGSLT